MQEYNPKNERIKKEYFRFLKEADQKAETTINGIRKAISRFEAYTEFEELARFNKQQAIGFKKHLANTRAARTGEPLSKSTILSTINALKSFFKWLSLRPSYKSRIHLSDIEYFNLSEKETRAAKTPRFKDFPTLEQIRKVIFSMPSETEIENRDRALIAFTMLTGMRDSAIASLCLGHVDIVRELVKQHPSEVKTKFSKRIDTYFFPVGDDIKAIVLDWINYLRANKLYGHKYPVFPRTKIGQDRDLSFEVQGLEPQCWNTTGPIRQIFKNAFEGAGLSYFNPHSFRNTLVNLAERYCRTPEEFKAWSQNLGHENVLTTFTSYGNIDPHRQGEVIKSLLLKEREDDKFDRILQLLGSVETVSSQNG